MNRWLLLLCSLAATSQASGCDREPFAAREAAEQSSGRPAAPAPPVPTNGGKAKRARQAPDGFVQVRVGGITPTVQGNAVLLVDDDKQRALVVFIGDTEALSIQLRMQGTKYKRPLTHDLIDNMLEQLDASVDSVRVDRLQDDIFYGVVVLSHGNKLMEFDSRTSDGIALALGNDAPVFVAQEVLDRASVSLDLDGSPSAAAPSETVERTPIAL